MYFHANISVVFRAAVPAAFLWAGLQLSDAQTLDTAVLGVVSDASGAVISGAAVTIRQPETGLTRTVLTKADGQFEVRYLLPGEYVLSRWATSSKPSRF